MNDNLLIENAVLAFLHNYPKHEWVDDYKILLDKLERLKNAKPDNTETRKRGRPAKKQRTQKTSSNTASKEASQTT